MSLRPPALEELKSVEGEIGRLRELVFWGHPFPSARGPCLSLILKNKEVLWPQLYFFIDFGAEGKRLECQVRRARLCPHSSGYLLSRHNLSVLPTDPKAFLFLSLLLSLERSQMG